ncbi:alpha/beta hydrolase [Spirosoma utsteinense]|uniref:Acetyl esterase/lipase n=1 Tax=Spirosoma utsteinense TaxID=2585773 RepID=A0ABR6W463_9BACT|nr:alpha/beta hydrolase [Spirosoma utsteinense]MBC3787059.1 acetyl esterase/lipase [Spirosoma utsteinense]MBC3791392.1 acetyl esterase/lipase [Spirosoma utsteinense]
MTFSRLFWQVPTALGTCVILLFLVLLVNECAVARPSKRTKDIAYRETGSPGFSAERHVLDVYAPTKKRAGGYPVVLFIHGGNWDSGSKNIYWFIGRRLAKQGVVAVIINYRLAPNVLVPAMADDCADAVLWTTRHIAEYGGDPNRIFTMGHSAGGGLAALMATKDELFTGLGLTRNPVKGAILDDPAGLDMYDYLQKMEYPNDQQYLVPFGKDPTVWRSVSPMYFVGKDSPPMLLYTGGKTYPSISISGGVFDRKLTGLGIKHTYIVMAGKKHVPMVTQLFWANNLIYRDLLKFVGAK